MNESGARRMNCENAAIKLRRITSYSRVCIHYVCVFCRLCVCVDEFCHWMENIWIRIEEIAAMLAELHNNSNWILFVLNHLFMHESVYTRTQWKGCTLWLWLFVISTLFYKVERKHRVHYLFEDELLPEKTVLFSHCSASNVVCPPIRQTAQHMDRIEFSIYLRNFCTFSHTVVFIHVNTFIRSFGC